ncbi:hypothetical protein GK091_24245 [Spirosoma agri]|uniref:Uncharacterized protein n=1 Tax=Spirosoma agri TaxID=1987381 RepID=A0A6M0IPR0_9BACT|nr:hypothetical protein [Spirosoma agri]NEU70014.1 hypothetical protein [Spirosoma agri]
MKFLFTNKPNFILRRLHFWIGLLGLAALSLAYQDHKEPVLGAQDQTRTQAVVDSVRHTLKDSLKAFVPSMNILIQTPTKTYFVSSVAPAQTVRYMRINGPNTNPVGYLGHHDQPVYYRHDQWLHRRSYQVDCFRRHGSSQRQHLYAHSARQLHPLGYLFTKWLHQ